MKKSFSSIACAATVATAMLLQIFTPSVVLAIDTAEETELNSVVETTESSESEETSVDVIEIEESSETTLVEYVEETENLTETETTEVIEEEIISSETNTDPTDEIIESVETSDETVIETETSEVLETEETIDTEEVTETSESEELEEIEYIEFDHYYSDINESLVNTTELFVITSDSSVFTRNTNVVSNYDNAYIIECESVEEARFVYSYYVDKVEFITDLSAVASVASPDDTEEVDETVPTEPELSESSETIETTETTEAIEPIESQTEETLETTVTETSETILEDVDTTEPTETEVQEPDLADLSDLNNGSDAISNLNGIDTVHNDYSGYIALIDTGANAHANFTVLDGDTFDHNGHGTNMLSYIRSENPQAQVVSIKVSEDGNATAADIYAGFRLAIDLNVSVINFSMTALDIEKNAVIRDVIQEALNAGIVVIGAAGNNAISADHFIPGCIEGVVIVGAATMGGTRYHSSNYNADCYVVAESTSEATARYTGLYTSNTIAEATALYRLFTELEESEYAYAYEIAEEMTIAEQTEGYNIFYTVVINEDGTVSFVPEQIGEDFVVCDNAAEVLWATTDYVGSIPAGTYSGTCTTAVAPGNNWPSAPRAYATGFQGNNAFSAVANTLGNIPIVCSKAFEDSFYGERYASNMIMGTCNYTAEVDSNGNITLSVASGRDATINCGMNMSSSERTARYTYKITATGSAAGANYTITVTGTNPITGAPDNYTASASSLSDLASKVNAHYSAKVSLDLVGVGSFTIEHFGSQTYRGLLKTSGITPHGFVRIRKTDSSNTGLAGATITLTGTFNADEFSITGNSGSYSFDGNTVRFTTGTGTVTIFGLAPGSNFIFTETNPPTGCSLASPVSATFATDADGKIINTNATGNWSFNNNTATFTLVNNYTQNGLTFNKVNESGGDDVAGAGIFFAATADCPISNPFAGITVSGGAYYAAGSAITLPDGSSYTAQANGYYFVTNGSGNDFSVQNVPANAKYIFTEIYVPNGYGKANDIIVSVDGAGNISPNSGHITMLEPGTTPHGSLAIVKIVDSADQFGFYSNLYTRHTDNFTWGWPIIDFGVHGLSFGVYWYGADASQAAGMYNGIYSYGAGTIADGRVDRNAVEQRVMWAPGPEYNNFIQNATTMALPFRWMGSNNEASWELRDYQTSTLGYLPEGYYLVTEEWNTTVFGPFHGDQNAIQLYTASMNAGGWTLLSNTGIHQEWGMMYHVTPQGTYRCRVESGTSGITDTGTLEHREGDNYNELDEGRDMRYAQPTYVDYITCRNVNSGTTFDLTKIDESGMGVDGISFSLWHNDSNGTPQQEIAIGLISNPNNPVQNSSGDQYNVGWVYQTNAMGSTPRGDIAMPDGSTVSWPGGDYIFSEIYAPDKATASWVVRNNAYREAGGTWGNAPDNYPIPMSYACVRGPIYWNDTDWIQENYEEYITASLAYYGENGSNGGLGNNSHYAGTADNIMNLPLGSYQIREYYDPSINLFKTPEGWSGPITDSTGTYFYRNIDIGNDYNGQAYAVTVTNETQGRIDITKVNLTGGPLSDLGFEIRNGNTVIATGSIATGTPSETMGTGRETDYTYSATWSYTDRNGRVHSDQDEATVGLGTFEVREYIPASAFDNINDLVVNNGWSGPNGPVNYNGRSCYYFTQTVVINNTNADELQLLTIRNSINPPNPRTTMTDFADRHITVVGDNIEFTDVVEYSGLYIGGTYAMNATLMDANTGNPVTNALGDPYRATTVFTATSGSGTVDVTFTVNTSDLVRATLDNNGVVSYSPRSVVCFEALRLIGNPSGIQGPIIVMHADLNDEAQTVTIDNPELETTFTSVQNIRSHAPVGETVEFIDTVTYTNLHAGEYYEISAYVYDQSSGQMIMDSNNEPYSNRIRFLAEEESGTIEVPITINTADIIKAYVDGQGVIHEQTKNIVCYEYLYSDSGILIGGHTDIDDEGQTIEITPPEIGTTFTDLQTEEHETVSGRVVQVVDTVSYTGLHVGETYTLTCFLYDKITGNQLEYSDGTLVVGTRTFEAETADGEVRVEFTIDTSDLLVNVFEREERTTVAFEYLRTENDILIGGHTDISDLPQGITPRLPEIRTSIVDDQTGTHKGRLGATVPFTDTVWYTNLNIGETYVMRGRIVNRDNPSIVYAEAEQEFIPQSREGTVEVHFTVDTSMVCEGSYEAHMVCFEQLWQLDTEGTGRGEVMLAHHEDVRDQGQTIDLHPEIGTQMIDPVTQCQYGLIGENVEFIDTVSYRNLHVDETYTVSGIIMDKQTGEPVLDRNGNPFTASTTFVPETSDGTVNVVYHVDTLYLISQIGQTINGVTIEAPREIVSFETITSTSEYDFEIHADIEDEGQTIILGDIRSGAGDVQTSTSWLAAGLTTIRDTVHYRGLGPVEYTVRGSLHYVDYDENGNPIDGGLIQARPGEITETEYTWTPTYHEGDINLDYRLDSNRFQGRDIIVFEELWYNGICIISHEHYSDSYGNYGMNNVEQTVHVASVWTSAFSFQSGEQLLAYDEHATVTDFVYYGNVEVGQDYYCEASLWACYTDENGYIHQTPITQEDGGIATSPVFRATENHGIAEVTFTIDATKLFDQHYDYLLVTERLIHVGSGVCIATHSDLTSKEQSINIPELHTTATDGATGGKVLTETATATIVDRVYYENLIPNTEYTIVGNVQYAKIDANGNVTESGELVQNGVAVTASHTFVPTSSSGYVDLTFTVNALEIDSSVSKLVVFEDIYTGPGIRVGTHANITDESQTIYLNGKIHIQVAKVDADNINYFLQGAEITIFNSDGTIATDVNGNPCVGVTNADGLVDFIVSYDPNNTYYAMETAAPEGYDINTNKFYVEVSVADRDAGIMLIPITITDVALNIPPRTSIPPRTGDNIALYAIITVLAACGIAGGAFFITKKKKDSES